MAKEEKLSHLILVVDEFTELKRFTSENSDIDFIGQITTIARVGRSLGYHICLISQNIQGAITEDISVNSKSRLCLKVATSQASKEMIGNELAAAPSMPGNGRAYLLVGTGSKFVYFQSAYSGSKILNADAAKECDGLNDMAFEITTIEPGGAYTSFYQSNKDNDDVNKQIKELSEQGKLQSQLEAITKSIKMTYETYRKRDQLSPPYQVFQAPLPTCIALGEDGTVVPLKKEDFGEAQHGI
jgi:S-DNA-T family DNA segregation ATPase FtsK/SpoIIIE